ncbi:TRAP transporter substrate-binding protein [Brooklawnia cerclae]|uniref:Tripartite ATP-independent transporter DctP family solute receptor n=1 Tax=Brooklawnia cerclae TaxID=349934 RepID=A0ABX0SCK5_9ACTN|nr:TRAP transporter substrate-binding protein [Brooklawnia cerclae]NIH55750.1 tripartite ATP-independent transporter DctP family solute receptor [Brooklawnia cerclae]
MSLKKILAGGAMAALLCSMAACGADGGSTGASSGGTSGKELKLSINQTEQHPNYIALAHLADRMRERTDGRINIKVYPNAVLGAQTESMQSLEQGVIDLASLSAPQLVNLNTDFQVLDLPLVFDSVEHQMNCLNDPDLVGDLYMSLADSHNMVITGAYTQGARSVYNSKQPIVTPDDMKGLKIRVQETDTQVKMIEAMGATASPLSFGEVYGALQTGVIDGAENNQVSYITMKHYEVAKYYSYTNHLIGADLTIVNADVYNSWSDEDKEVWQEEFAASVDEFNELWDATVADAEEQTKAAGSQYNEVDADAFRAVLQPVTEAALTTETQKALYQAFRERAE